MPSLSSEGKPLIFLDLDGVCCDFLSGVARLFGHESLDDLPVGEYDLAKLFNTTWPDVDLRIRESVFPFWLNLKPYPWTKKMVRLLQEMGEVVILSSPWPQDSECHRQKLLWVDRELGIPHSEVILTPHKHLLAAPGRLLIDDRIDTCQEWAMLGGAAIVFPAHHNRDQIECLGGDPFFHLVAALDVLSRKENPAHADHSNN